MSKHAEAFHKLAVARGYDLAPEQRLDWLTPRAHATPEVAAKLPKRISAALDRIFDELRGDRSVLLTKTRGHTNADFLLPDGREVEHDERQHLTRPRLRTLELYPRGVDLGFDLAEYRDWCERWWPKGEKYRTTKPAID